MIRPFLASLCLGLTMVSCSPSEPDSFDPTQSTYFSEQDNLITIDGQTIRYRESGDADAPVLLLLHGFTDSLHTWDRLAARLDNDFRIIRPDLPGHGLSGTPPNDDYSNDALVGFVGAFLDEIAVDKAIVVGNSLGGLAAWRVAFEAPDRVSALVLLAPGGVPYNGIGEEPLPVPAMLGFYLKNAPKPGVRAALESMHVDKSLVTEEFVDQVRDMMRMPGNGDAFVARAGSFTLPDPATDMAKIEAPTVILWGAQDTVLPAAQADIFAANMPDADIILLEQVGHMPQSEAADQVAAAIRSIAAKSGDGT